MKKIVSLFSLMGIIGISFAQENLVPNHDFQQIEKRVKEEGQINMATPWISPTLAPADLYTKDTKNGNVGAPANAYGEEKPMSGDNYAGFMAYSYKNKEPRSYLQVQLKEKLVAGKKYCVTMNVSLADLSKYATSHIGMSITKNAISANNTDNLKVEKQIISKKLMVYEQQFYWVPVCGVFTAEGDEEFLTIGNFTPDESLKLEKVKRPRGFSKPQLYDAYYYVDNISVVETTTPRDCDCDTDPGMKNVETVSRNFSSENDPSANKVKIVGTHGDEVNANPSSTSSGKLESLDGFSIGFVAKSFSVKDNVKQIEQLITYLKANPTVKVKLIGHIDVSEQEVDKLDGKRVAAVYKYILSKGIKVERLERDLKSSEEPVDEKDPLKNMRVEVIVVE